MYTVHRIVNEKGQYHLPKEAFPLLSDVSRYDLEVVDQDKSRLYPIFRQAARAYGDYDDYMEHHGCACCSLTTLLAAYSNKCKDLTPDMTASKIEKLCFGREAWHKNYDKPMKKQMPVSFYGITRILDKAGIDHTYVMSYDKKTVHTRLKEHLEEGKIAVIETSRIRYKGPFITSINDRTYSGSYHTMLLLGIEEDGDTVWLTDSAYRAWSGTAQRLKRASLTDLLHYMFPCKNKKTGDYYYSGRRNTGGFILIHES